MRSKGEMVSSEKSIEKESIPDINLFKVYRNIGNSVEYRRKNPHMYMYMHVCSRHRTHIPEHLLHAGCKLRSNSITGNEGYRMVTTIHGVGGRLQIKHYHGEMTLTSIAWDVEQTYRFILHNSQAVCSCSHFPPLPCACIQAATCS